MVRSICSCSGVAGMPASRKKAGPSSRHVGMESSSVPSISKIALCNRICYLNSKCSEKDFRGNPPVSPVLRCVSVSFIILAGCTPDKNTLCHVP